MIKCPNPDCGYENVDGTQFCEGCGEELPQNNVATSAAAPVATPVGATSSGAATAIKCPACDNLNDPANEFCEVCGTPLHDAAAASGGAASSGGAGASGAATPDGVGANPAGTSATPGTSAAPTAASGSVLSADSAPAASPNAAPMNAANVGAAQTPPDVAISGLSDTSAGDALTPVVASGDVSSAVSPDAIPSVAASPVMNAGTPMADDPSVAPTISTGASTPDAVVGTDADATAGSALSGAGATADATASTSGGEMAPGLVKLTVEQGMTIGKQFVLGDNEMLVGREDEDEQIYPDIDLSDQDEGYVHRKHAELKFENGGLTLTHLGGANKTRINNRPLPDNEAQPVKIGDKIAFGKVVMRVGAM